MPCMLSEFQTHEKTISTEAHALYMVMFWEMPQEFIEYFLGKVSECSKLDGKQVMELLRLPRYSDELCQKPF